MKDYAHPYQKLGGWLLFFVVTTFFNAFSGILVQLLHPNSFLHVSTTYEGGVFAFQLLITLCTLYKIALQITYAVMIVKREAHFARIWQLIYAGYLVGALVTLIMHLAYGFPQLEFVPTENYSVILGFIVDLFGFLPVPVGLTLLTLYLRKSVRVRTYMGSDEYLKLAFFVKKKPWPEPAAPDTVVPDEDEA